MKRRGAPLEHIERPAGAVERCHPRLQLTVTIANRAVVDRGLGGKYWYSEDA